MSDLETFKQGARVWLVEGDSADDWIPATIEENDSVEMVILSDYGESRRIWCSEATPSVLRPMDDTAAEGLDDMAKMSELNQASILCNLNVRYQRETIYTYIGSILISVNPYKKIDGLYDPNKLDLYRDKDLGEHPPHIYAIANECYSCMWKREESQCVLISGESGAGKTEATKLMLRFLSNASQIKANKSEAPSSGRNASIEQSILESGPLLEAFGNAKTVYNNNSSRFGKFIQLLFASNGGIQGGRITDYLLEKHRVVRQNPGERNYHVFYQMLAGLTQEKKDSLLLTSPDDFHYLNTTGCTSDPTLDDVADWEALENALKVIGFKAGQCSDMHSILAGILHLGNVEFVNAGGAQITEVEAVDRASQLLGVESERLESVLKERTMKLRGESIASPQSVDQACDSRDSISMAVYSQLFRWMISKINHRIKGPDDFHFIGILDIFGFENFQVNRFEQFCINFANEKLQEFFNRHIFSLEQIEYRREEVEWCDIEWTDNSECLDLIEKNMGIMSLINEESRFPKGTDQSLLNKMHSQHQDNTYYVKPRVSGCQYGIKHYAGEVLYTITGFLEKNRDTFRDDLLNLLKDSSNDLIYDLFEKVRGNSESTGKGRGKKATTMSGQFKLSLHSLMERLSTANPFFVRCIKPNMKKIPDNFLAGVVLNQLKYSGMLETVRVRRAGFPVRRLYQDFADRYWMVKKFDARPNNPKDTSREVLALVDDTSKFWKLGKTKVFLKEALEQKLEKSRQEKVNVAAFVVQKTMRMVACRRRFLKMKRMIVHVQRHVRGFIVMRRFKRTVRAILLLQRVERGRKARILFRQLLAEKREKERIRLEKTIIIQKYTRGLLQRRKYKIILEKHRELLALKEQMEREKRERIEREKREREERERKEEEERLARQKELELEQQEKEMLMLPPSPVLEEAPDDIEFDFDSLPPPPLDGADLLPLPPLNGTDLLSPSEDDFISSPSVVNSIGDSPGFYDDPYPFSEDRILLKVGSEKAREPLRESAILADFDAVLKDADDLSNVDSAYSTVRKGNKSYSSDENIYDDMPEDVSEAERAELERILELEREIQELQAARPEPEIVEVLEVKAPSNEMDILKDLGFEELESTLDNLIEGENLEDFGIDVRDITPMQSDEENEGMIPTMTEEEENVYDIEPEDAREPYPDSDTDSFFTDSTFSSDDDVSEETEGDVAAGSAADANWKHSVYFHGYLLVKGGIRNQWKRRWCVLLDDLFMFFRSKQEYIKCGWLNKKSSASKVGSLRGTLPRKSWQKKWFVIDGSELQFFDTDEDGAKQKGVINIHKATDISDETEKANGIDIVMSSTKSYHLSADNEDEAADWFSVLSKIHTSCDEEIAMMEKAQANPRNASGTVEVQDIQSVNAAELSGKKHSFVVMTAQRVHSFACENQEEMHHWITLLNESKQNTAHGDYIGSVTQGWLFRGIPEKNRMTYQKRFFKLTQNAIEYYKSPNSSQKLGCLALNSLCIVSSPDEYQQKTTGFWEIVVYGRKHTLRLNSKLFNDAQTWCSEIQNAIDSNTMVVTRTEQLLSKFKDVSEDKEIDLIYKKNPVLRQSDEVIRSPLLPLVYEQVPYREDHFTLRDEATRLFGVILQMESATFQSIEEEAAAIQKILRPLHDFSSLQDEFYLQLIKQTAIYQAPLTSKEELQSQLHVTSCPHYWHLIACMCCAYHPSRKVMQYLKFHLTRVQEKYPESPAAQYANYAMEALKKTRHRLQVPSIEEIVAILECRNLVTTIFCYGGATCEIQINSATTAGEVVKKLLRGMDQEGNNNTFALFERRGNEDKAIEANTIVADVIAKFERLNNGTATTSDTSEKCWILYFKLYCVFNPMEAKETSIEYLFLFEEIHEQVINGLYPMNDEATRQLAALRTQFVKGDYQKMNWDRHIEEFYPVCKMRRAYDLAENGTHLSFPQNSLPERRSPQRGSLSLGFAEGQNLTKKKSSNLLNSLKWKSIKRIKEEASQDEMSETLFREELQDVKSNIVDRWYKLKGMTQSSAVVEYVNLARTWPGFGSTLFPVTNNESAFGDSALTIGVASDGIKIYKRGNPTVMDHFTYSGMRSFGAASNNQLRVEVEGRGEFIFVTDNVLEIIKLMNAFIKAMVRRKPR